MKKTNRPHKNIIRISVYFISFQLLLTTLFAYSLTARNIKNIEIKKSGSYIYWYEGRRKKRLKIIPDEIAQFNGKSEESIKSIDNRSSTLIRGKKMKIWKVKDESIKGMLKKGQIPPALKGNYSPVFKDPSGRKRTLPGNVLVYFNKNITDEDIYKWAETHNYKIIKKISKYNNAYLIKTPPGIESLNISNEINAMEGVVFSTPDWWIDIRLK